MRRLILLPEVLDLGALCSSTTPTPVSFVARSDNKEAVHLCVYGGALRNYRPRW